MNDPQKAIVGALAVAAGVLTWRNAKAGTLTPRTYAGFAVVAFFLLALGTFAPELAAAFAILVLVVVLLSSAKDIQSLANVGRAA